MLSISMIFFSCQSVDIKEVKNNSWKESGGKYIKGVIIFHENKESGFYVDSTCNIYYHDSLVGKIIKANSDEMIIETPQKEKAYFLSF